MCFDFVRFRSREIMFFPRIDPISAACFRRRSIDRSIDSSGVRYLMIVRIPKWQSVTSESRISFAWTTLARLNYNCEERFRVANHVYSLKSRYARERGGEEGEREIRRDGLLDLGTRRSVGILGRKEHHAFIMLVFVFLRRSRFMRKIACRYCFNNFLLDNL